METETEERKLVLEMVEGLATARKTAGKLVAFHKERGNWAMVAVIKQSSRLIQSLEDRYFHILCCRLLNRRI